MKASHLALKQKVATRWAAMEAARLARTQIRIFDGDMRLYGEIAGELEHEFEFVDNDTGTASVKLPHDHYVATWAVNFRGREKRNVHVAFDRQGARWTGRMDNFKVHKDKGSLYVELTFKHDFEELKHIYCWSNPFLPAEFQFPRIWLMFGKAKWALLVTLLANLQRKEASLWMFPEDPGQLLNLDRSTWDIVIKPFPYADDNTPPALVVSRFKSFYDVQKNITADAQLSWDLRRWFTGDPPPWPGAVVKNGALIVDLVDKSGWLHETSFFGNTTTGLERAFVQIASDGLTEGIDVISGDPTFPGEYYQPGWRGTRPQAPHVVFQDLGWNGIETSDFVYYEATDVQVVTGGHSAPYVNEAISAGIIALGGFIGSLFLQSQIGPAVDAIAKPLYTDTVLAFMAWKDIGRAQDLGDFHYFEKWADGADKAYTLAAVVALRAGMFSSKERISCTVEVADAAPYIFAPPGYGDAWIGDRVAVGVRGMPEHELYVEQIQKLKYRMSPSDIGWKATIGRREPEDPLMKAFELAQELASAVKELGV